MKKRHHITLLLIALVAIMVLSGCSPSGPEQKVEEPQFMTDEDLATLASLRNLADILPGLKEATTKPLNAVDLPDKEKGEGKDYAAFFRLGTKNSEGLYEYTIPFGKNKDCVITSSDGRQYNFKLESTEEPADVEPTPKKVSEDELICYQIYDAIGKVLTYYGNVSSTAYIDTEKTQSISFSSSVSGNKTLNASLILRDFKAPASPASPDATDDVTTGDSSQEPSPRYITYSGNVQVTASFSENILENFRNSLETSVNAIIENEASESETTSDGKNSIAPTLGTLLGNLPEFSIKISGELSARGDSSDDNHDVELNLVLDSAKYSKKINAAIALFKAETDGMPDFSGFISLAVDLCMNQDLTLRLDGKLLDITQTVTKILFRLLGE